MMPTFNANIQFKLSLKEILKINNNNMKKIKSSFAYYAQILLSLMMYVVEKN